jgi:hypothetical protein
MKWGRERERERERQMATTFSTHGGIENAYTILKEKLKKK